MSAVRLGALLKIFVLVLAIVCTVYINSLKDTRKDSDGCVDYGKSIAISCSLGISATLISVVGLYILVAFCAIWRRKDTDFLTNSVCLKLDRFVNGLFSLLELGSCLALCSLLKEGCPDSLARKMSIVLVLKLVIVLVLGFSTVLYTTMLRSSDWGSFDSLAKRDVICIFFCMVFSFVVYVCVVVDGYTEGKCVYDGENAACVFSVYMGLLATVIAFALLAGGWFLDSDSYVNMTRFCGCCLSLAFLVCFSYTTHNWHDDGSGDHFTISARAALAFQFFSFVLWAFPSVLVSIRCILDNREICRHSTDTDQERFNPVPRSVHPSFGTTSYYEEERLNPVSRSTHPSSGRSSYYEGLKPLPGSLPSTRERSPYGLSSNPAESGPAFRSEKRLASEEERFNPVRGSVHPSFGTRSDYEEERLNPVSRSVHPRSGRSHYEEERFNPVRRSVHPSFGTRSDFEASQLSDCEYRKLCSRYLRSLRVPDKYFDTMYDICFCQECHEEREDDDYYNRGIPPKEYALPIEWCRFGLRIRKSAPDSWHIAFHGTTPDRVLSILESGLVPAGGVTDRGEEVFERSGHFTPSRKPYSEFDTKQIFVSPTIRYAGREEYAKFGKL